MCCLPGVGDCVGAMLAVGAEVSRGVGLMVGVQEPAVFESSRPLNLNPIDTSYSTRSDRLHAFMMKTVHVPLPDNVASDTSICARYVPLRERDHESGHSVVTCARPTEVSAPPTETASPCGETSEYKDERVSLNTYATHSMDRAHEFNTGLSAIVTYSPMVSSILEGVECES